MAKPLGIIFWGLSVACLCLGFGNYVKTVNKYSRRAAIVQTGWKTQTVSCFSVCEEGEREDVLEVEDTLIYGLGLDCCRICHRCSLYTVPGD